VVLLSTRVAHRSPDNDARRIGALGAEIQVIVVIGEASRAREIRTLVGDSASVARLPLATSKSVAVRVLADWSRTELRDIDSGARRGDFVPSNAFAHAYAELQERDKTLRWLESMRIARDPSIHSVPLNPLFDFLRNDARYQAWEAKLTWRHPGGAAPVGTAALTK
jgi:hypothetical protein